MMRLLPLLLAAIALLSGCSSIMRPPPAAAFMDTYKQEKAVNMIAASAYAGNLENRKEEETSYSEISHEEWWVDGHFAHYLSSGYFTFGLGLQSMTGFMQGGFVSPYFGLSAWSNMNALIIPAIKDEDRGFWTHYSGGAMAIEQLPLTQKWSLGFTQHLSRNGREVYYVDKEDYGFNFDKPRPKFYMEMGGGLYGRYKGEKASFSLEFRYGRDTDFNKNRFAFTFNVWGLSKPILTPNGLMRDMAAKTIDKREKIKIGAVSDSTVYNDATKDTVFKSGKRNLHKIKERWFSVSDSSKVISKVYAPTPIDYAIYTNAMCYDDESGEAWLKQENGKNIYAVPLNEIDYCEEAEMQFPWKTALLEGLLIGTTTGLLTYNIEAFLIGDAIGTAGFWMLFKATDVKIPKKLNTICKIAHTPEEKESWFKQYPCFDSSSNEF